jgi:hypothetical protein
MSMQGSAMMYVTPSSLRDELFDQLTCSFGQCRPRHDSIESRCLARSEARRVGVIRVPEDGNIGVRVGDFLRVHSPNVDDDDVRRLDRVCGRQTVSGEERVELPPEKEIDPDQQDRRHGRESTTAWGARIGLC